MFMYQLSKIDFLFPDPEKLQSHKPRLTFAFIQDYSVSLAGCSSDIKAALLISYAGLPFWCCIAKQHFCNYLKNYEFSEIINCLS